MLLRRAVGERVRLKTHLRPLAGQVEIDPGQLEQVLMNLAINARDAMPVGGRITVETADAELEEGDERTEAGIAPGQYVVLAVSDTGCGMTPEVQARVFEPFFTTKEAGKGTGLGLAVVHGIVRQAGGHIQVSSAVGAGTTFSVYLPRVEGQVGPLHRPVDARKAPRGTETVLLVEDEGGVRTLARHALAGCGYTVLEAADGNEALQVACGHSGPIHLLVLDVVMPALGGRALADKALALHPEAKVLYVSGDTDAAVVRDSILHHEAHFLQKPFSATALACKARDLLDAGH
jgi:CheY-like chemotaxis protein